MFKNLLLTLLLPVIFACSKEDKLTENVPVSVKQAMEQTDCSCEPYIDLYKWHDQQLYFFGYKGPACDWVPRFVDAEGNDVSLSQEEIQQFHNEATKIKNIWTCSEK